MARHKSHRGNGGCVVRMAARRGRQRQSVSQRTEAPLSALLKNAKYILTQICCTMAQCAASAPHRQTHTSGDRLEKEVRVVQAYKRMVAHLRRVQSCCPATAKARRRYQTKMEIHYQKSKRRGCPSLPCPAPCLCLVVVTSALAVGALLPKAQPPLRPALTSSRACCCSP